MRANPVASAEFRAAFGHPAALRAWAIFLGALTLVLGVWWPRSDLAWHLRTATPPQTFVAVAVVLLLLAGYQNARAGADDRVPSGEAGLAELVALTPLPVARVVAGRLAAGTFVVLVQLALALPFLLASLGVSGISVAVLPAVAAVVAASALGWRTSALALRLALPNHPVLRDVLLFAGSAAYLAVTFVAAPAANPLSALVAIGDAPARTLAVAGASLPFSAVSAIIGLLVSIAATAAAAGALRAARSASRGGAA